MKETFLQLTTSTELNLMLRFLLIPFLTLVLYYLLLMLFMRLKFIKPISTLDNFFLNFQFSKMYSISATTLLLNGYWYYLLYNNSVSTIEWGFVFKISNIYLQLAPFIISNFLLVMIYKKANKTILNII